MGDRAEDNGYFTVCSVPFAGARWTFADARNSLLIVFGLTEESGRLVLIRQYRPPVAATVLSAPMGCYPDAGAAELLSLAATEAEAETGHKVLRIEYLLSFARSPGLTSELARCFVASYAEARGPCRLHADEQIEVQYVEGDAIGRVVEQAAADGVLLDSSVLLCGPWLLQKLELLRRLSRAEQCAAADRPRE
jgi:hypothetical protein